MKQAIKAIVFALLTAGLIYCAYGIYSWKDTSGDYLSSTQQLYHTPENTMDVVFVGSSHCYCTIYPALLWERSGIAAFDMATSGQDKASSYHVLAELLKTQSPKTVWVDLYGLLLERQGIEGNTYRNMLALRTSRNSLELIREYVEPERRMDFYLKWPIVHTRFWEIGKYDFVPYEPSQYGRGAVYQWGQEAVEAGEYETDEAGELTEVNRNWLERLRSLSEKEGFDLCFFVAPFRISGEEQKQINAARDYAKAQGIPFYDFNKMAKDLDLDYQKDFRESFHLNAYGAEKVTEFVRTCLLERGDLADQRGRKGYEAWDLDLEWYRHLELYETLSAPKEAKDYVEALANAQDVMTIVCVEGVPADEVEEKAAILAPLGITLEDVLAGGKWIIRNGEKRKALEPGPEKAEYWEDLNSFDALRLRSGEKPSAEDLMINYDGYLREDVPVTILPYDLFLKETFPATGF